MTLPTEMAAEPRNDATARVLIADGSDRLRQRLHDLMTGDGRFVVVGSVGLLPDLLAACTQLAPDVLVLGLGDEGDGAYALSALAALKAVARRLPSMAAVVLVANDEPAHLVAAVRASATCVLLRDVDERLLPQAALAGRAGRPVLDPRLTRALFGYVANGEGRRDDRALSIGVDPAVRMALSPREQEVLRCLAQGRRNDEIAAALGVSVGTVKTHLRHIYRKLDVDDRLSAVLTAFQIDLQEAA